MKNSKLLSPTPQLIERRSFVKPAVMPPQFSRPSRSAGPSDKPPTLSSIRRRMKGVHRCIGCPHDCCDLPSKQALRHHLAEHPSHFLSGEARKALKHSFDEQRKRWQDLELSEQERSLLYDSIVCIGETLAALVHVYHARRRNSRS